MEKRILINFIFITIMLAIVVDPSQVNAQPAKTLKVGALLPLSGAMAAGGKDWQNAYELWKEKANARGGLNVGGQRYTVEVVYYDYASNTDTAVKIADKLVVQDGIKFVFGPYGSMAVAAVAPVLEKYGAVHLTMAATRTIFEKGYKYSFSLFGSTEKFSECVFELLSSLRPKPRTIALLARNDALPLAYLNSFSSLAKQYGLELVQAEKFPADSTDFMTPLTITKAKSPEVFGFFAYRNEGILMVQQAAQIGFTPKFITGQVDWDSKSFFDAVGEQAMGLTTFVPWSSSFPASFKDDFFGSPRDYAKAYRDKYGYDPGYSSAGASAWGVVLSKCIERAGSLDPNKVRDNIANFRETIFYGPIKFDPQGQLDRGSYVIQIQRSGLTVVSPEAKTGDIIYPFQWKKGSN
jgi:branched-chain amino acid transport system substrate-binding protein